MRTNIEERAIELAKYIIDNRATVRAAAKRFGVSKSTVHTVLTKRNGQMPPRKKVRGREGRAFFSPALHGPVFRALMHVIRFLNIPCRAFHCIPGILSINSFGE